jgi:hypothetical protein
MTSSGGCRADLLHQVDEEIDEWPFNNEVANTELVKGGRHTPNQSHEAMRDLSVVLIEMMMGRLEEEHEHL